MAAIALGSFAIRGKSVWWSVIFPISGGSQSAGSKTWDRADSVAFVIRDESDMFTILSRSALLRHS
jgi:hypothetical protein